MQELTAAEAIRRFRYRVNPSPYGDPFQPLQFDSRFGSGIDRHLHRPCLPDRMPRVDSHRAAKGQRAAHRKYTHAGYPGAVTLSGGTGDDVKRYQEKQVRRAIDQVQE